jgi:hypothetical protein
LLHRRCARFLAVAVLFAGTSAGCASPSAEFATKYAPSVRREGLTVSVFGVYKDGRMSTDSWADLKPSFATVMGGTPCDSLLTEPLVMEDRDVGTALDDTTRAEGVSDQLLDVFAPAASGDAIMLVTVAGRPPGDSPRTSSLSGTQPASFTQAGKARRSIAGNGRTDLSGVNDPMMPRTSREAFEVAVTLYSIRDHQTVALVAMTYTGKSVDEAMAAMIAKLRAELPGMRCVGWKPDVRVEAERVRTPRPRE